MSIADTIKSLFDSRGNAAYFGEPVSQTEHAVQTAELAIQESSEDSMVVAALLHDIGHLLHDENEDIADQGIDARHEEIGYRWLTEWFGANVTEPVRLHVAAKRYLCTTTESYLQALSPASQQSFVLQGGAMSTEEVAEFESHEFFKQALRLRNWDDAAKVQGLHTPSIERYRSSIELLALLAESQ